MYQEDGYVVLETNQPEQLMTKEELFVKLKQFLILLKERDNLPFDVKKYPTIEEQTMYVLDNYCELDVGEGEYLQWYVVRWEKE
jgi:hypothetical protein